MEALPTRLTQLEWPVIELKKKGVVEFDLSARKIVPQAEKRISLNDQTEKAMPYG